MFWEGEEGGGGGGGAAYAVRRTAVWRKTGKISDFILHVLTYF